MSVKCALYSKQNDRFSEDCFLMTLHSNEVVLHGNKPWLISEAPRRGYTIEEFHEVPKLEFFYDNQRHLVCMPYSEINLHIMAHRLKIKRCWFHGDVHSKHKHYDLPKSMFSEAYLFPITKVSPKEILKICKGLRCIGDSTTGL